LCTQHYFLFVFFLLFYIIIDIVFLPLLINVTEAFIMQMKHTQDAWAVIKRSLQPAATGLLPPKKARFI